MSTKIKVLAPVDTTTLAAGGESVSIKGTLYIQPNGDQFFEADENRPKDPKKKKDMNLHFSDGVVKHYTTAHKHLFYVSMDKKMTELVGSVLPRMVVRFCARASAKRVKYYVRSESENENENEK